MKAVACWWISGVVAEKKKKKPELAGGDAEVGAHGGETAGRSLEGTEGALKEETLQNEWRRSSGEC